MVCKCKTPPKKPCDHCYHWFECCDYGNQPEKCDKYNNQNKKMRKRSTKGGE